MPSDGQSEYEEASPGLRHEPSLALYADDDGLALYRDLFSKDLQPDTHVIIEALVDQHDELIDMAEAKELKLSAQQGLALCFIKK